MALTRRQFVAAASAVVAAPLATAACGFTGSNSSSDSDALTFTTWGTDAELTGFRNAISGFEKSSNGSKVTLNAVPYAQMFDDLDAQIAAGNAPDIFRVPYYTLGSYAGRGQLMDITKHLPKGFAQRFTPTAWAAVQGSHQGARFPVGVPHHTDTSAILYNKQLMKQAGVTSVPTSLEDAWTWKQFDAVLASMRKALPSDKYPLVVNWQGNGVTRWLSWLFEANGRFLSPDGTSSPIDSAAGRAAVDYTRAFFTEKYVPPNSSVKSTSLAQDIWFSQTAAMAFEGGFLLPDAKTTATFDWGATYPPRDHRAASDFGGNAVVVTSQTKKAEQAVAFLDYLTDAGVMKDFCARASLLPTRRDLVSSGIRYDVRGDLTKVFIDQASTVRPQDAAQVASPSMLKIITVLQDQLENAFVGGQSTQRTLSALAGGIESAVGK